MKRTGKIYLIPSSLGDVDLNNVLPGYNINIISSLDEFIVEDIRTARRFLREAGFNTDFDKVVFHILNEHTNEIEIAELIKSNLKGNNTGLLSEAGLPCVADPGKNLVKLAHQNNIKVVPLTGPSSIFLALMASGFNGQNFAFNGYLPIKKKARETAIKKLENKAYKDDQTQIFIETPYRNNQILEAIITTCSDDTLLCIACDITTKAEFIISKNINEWKKNIPDLHKRPCVFLLYK
jgi:16S rRNA (cytidine1402-2'-O)-methyltransferase